MEPFVKLFLDQKITLEFIKYQASQNLKRINVTSNYPEIPEIVKDQLKLTAKKITSYMKSHCGSSQNPQPRRFNGSSWSYLSLNANPLQW